MSIFKSYNSLSLERKLGIWGSIASIIGLILYFWPTSPATKLAQTATGSGATQIGTVSGNVTVNQPYPQLGDPVDLARNERMATQSMRAIARDRIPYKPPYPADWNEAEKYYGTAKYQFDNKDYVGAAQNYKHAFDAYADIIAKSNDK
ncbi:hypothetical protein [Chromobacterium violaceum]|uniref:hypothetical protein n=1 Tax=Chromobacterium violaceum TaxID=536 RepID=UPI003CF001A6